MKTHIIQLEPYDDVTTVRDKMAWGKSARILLVWPESEPDIMNRRLDLILIKRRAQELGSQLALVARDLDVRYYADELNIPIFRDISRAQIARWLQRKKSGAWIPPESETLVRTDIRSLRPVSGRGIRQPFIVRLAAALAATLSMLALAGVLLPRASITLTPDISTQQLEFSALTGPNITNVNASGAIPARPLTIVVEGRKSVPTTGSVSIPAEPARGLVLFSNLTTEIVRIDLGSVVLTSGSPSVRYAVTQAGTLAGEPGATVLLPVQAVLPGENGNVPAGAIVAVEGLLGLQLVATNPEALTGGSSITLAAPTDLDRSLAAGELRESLRRAAGEELISMLDENDLLLTATPFLLATQQETYLPAGDTPSDLVEANLRLEFQILSIAWEDVEQLARMVLDSGLPPGYEPVGEAISIEFLSEPVPDSVGSAAWRISAERQVRSVPAAGPVLNSLLGSTPALAADRLTSANVLGARPEIALSPDWWPRLPLLPIQIDINVTAP